MLEQEKEDDKKNDILEDLTVSEGGSENGDEEEDYDEDDVLVTKGSKKLQSRLDDDDNDDESGSGGRGSGNGISACCYRHRYCCFTTWALLTFLVSTFFVIRMSTNYDEIKTYVLSIVSPTQQANDWDLLMDSYGTESCIRLFDIDDDGLDDILFGLATVNEMSSETSGANVPKPFSTSDDDITCGQADVSSNCGGLMYGIRGYDGKVLWKFSTKSEVFEINCHSIDVNLDGKPDCLASGRRKTLLAFDPRTGKVLWESHSNFLKENWNIYNPVILPIDIDKDGVNEIVIAHGGNPTIPSHIKERESGRIILYSGRNGSVIGKYLPMPHDKETYMSPVLHTLKDGSSYLLLGSGGETVAGSFYAISLPNFYNYVSTYLLESKPEFKGTYRADGILKKKYEESPTIKGLFNLYESNSKGVMVPPVLCDVNNDGTKDILMSSFDGTLILYDGETFEKIWTKEYACHETYTSPAPGFFNDDDVPDFMLTQNYGAFDYYRFSVFNVLNGKDGSILWEMRSPRMQMISPLTIRSTEKPAKRDLFFFRVQGAEVPNISNLTHQVYHGLEPQQPIDRPMKRNSRKSQSKSKMTKRRDDGSSTLNKTNDVCPKYETFIEEAQDEDTFKPKCENDKHNNDYLSTYGLLIDRTIPNDPLVVFKSSPKTLVYNYTMDDMTADTETETGKEKRNAASEKLNYGSTCVVMEPMERNTGAIGDLDGDGIPDIVTILVRGGIVRKPKGGYLKILTEMFVTKKSLKTVFKKSQMLTNTDKTVTTNLDRVYNDETNIEKLNYEKIQTWTAYMGYYSDSSYD